MEFKWTVEKVEEIRRGLETSKEVAFVTFYKTEEGKSFWELTLTNGKEVKIVVSIINNLPIITEGWEQPEDVEEVEKTDSDLLEEWLDENEYDWSSYGFQNDIDYQIAGFTYNVTCYYEADSKTWVLYTTHIERMKKETDIMNVYGDIRNADGNEVRRKKLSSVFKYIEKWTDK